METVDLIETLVRGMIGNIVEGIVVGGMVVLAVVVARRMRGGNQHMPR